MDAQLTLRLPGELSEKLTQSAKRMKRKRSDVARLALEQFLGGGVATGRVIDRVGDLIGVIESGVPDLGSNHREHLIKRLRRG